MKEINVLVLIHKSLGVANICSNPSFLKIDDLKMRHNLKFNPLASITDSCIHWTKSFKVTFDKKFDLYPNDFNLIFVIKNI